MGCGKFCTWDLVFFLGYMVVVMVIGFAVGRREKSTINDYFRAGNRLPWYAIGFSIIAAGISSEQFVGEIGYAYKLGMPVVNWDWLIFPGISILLWIFVPIYVRNKVTTMPEYLEIRYGPRARTLYAYLIIASYIFANFALVFFTAGFAMEQMWGINRSLAIWIIAFATGAYTIYGGLASVAWTDFFQCALLMGGGLYVFFAGMAKIGWDFTKVLGTGQHAHMIAPADHPEIPWTALIILALSTNVWYYATDQFINQRCLGAKSEWHSKMGVLLAGALQLLLPLATCFPGMIYFVMNPNLADHNAAYPSIVAEVVPMGLRGLVAAAILGAIMSTVSGLVNSTSTMVTLDIFRRTKMGKDWPEDKLVRFGMWSGGIALIIGAAFSIVVNKWDDMFRYCQDIWAPMAAPAVVVFMAGALWKGAKQRGAVACLWLSILTVPVTFAKQMLIDMEILKPTFLPNLQNSMVFAGGIFLASIVLLVALSVVKSTFTSVAYSAVGCLLIAILAAKNPTLTAILVGASFILFVIAYFITNREAKPNMWDRSMLRLPKGERENWYSSVWFWWLVCGSCFVGLYYYFW